jgi:hypothetical protein
MTTLVVRSLGPGELDAAQVERDVAAQYEQREGVAIDVRCEEDMPKESGGVFACDGTTSEGEDLYIEIQIADPGEDVDYHWWTPR